MMQNEAQRNKSYKQHKRQTQKNCRFHEFHDVGQGIFLKTPREALLPACIIITP